MADTSLNDERIGLLIWKISNIWQSKLRKILKNYNLSLNEYLIIETIYKLRLKAHIISQVIISKNSFLDVSVVSTNLLLLENKKLIFRNQIDRRANKIELTEKGANIASKTYEVVSSEEINFFQNLRNETFNFKNSLKLLLGKKIRIKAIKK